MVVVVLIVVGLTVWFGVALLIDAFQGGRLDLAERLAPCPRSVADEARQWLDEQV